MRVTGYGFAALGVLCAAILPWAETTRQVLVTLPVVLGCLGFAARIFSVGPLLRREIVVDGEGIAEARDGAEPGARLAWSEIEEIRCERGLFYPCARVWGTAGAVIRFPYVDSGSAELLALLAERAPAARSSPRLPLQLRGWRPRMFVWPALLFVLGLLALAAGRELLGAICVVLAVPTALATALVALVRPSWIEVDAGGVGFTSRLRGRVDLPYRSLERVELISFPNDETMQPPLVAVYADDGSMLILRPARADPVALYRAVRQAWQPHARGRDAETGRGAGRR